LTHAYRAPRSARSAAFIARAPCPRPPSRNFPPPHFTQYFIIQHPIFTKVCYFIYRESDLTRNACVGSPRRYGWPPKNSRMARKFRPPVGNGSPVQNVTLLQRGIFPPEPCMGKVGSRDHFLRVGSVEKGRIIAWQPLRLAIGNQNPTRRSDPPQMPGNGSARLQPSKGRGCGRANILSGVARGRVIPSMAGRLRTLRRLLFLTVFPNGSHHGEQGTLSMSKPLPVPRADRFGFSGARPLAPPESRSP